MTINRLVLDSVLRLVFHVQQSPHERPTSVDILFNKVYQGELALILPIAREFDAFGVFMNPPSAPDRLACQIVWLITI